MKVNFCVLCALLAFSSWAWIFEALLVKKELDLIENESAHVAISFITIRCFDVIHLLDLSVRKLI